MGYMFKDLILDIDAKLAEKFMRKIRDISIQNIIPPVYSTNIDSFGQGTNQAIEVIAWPLIMILE
jgi:hypothetical protein